MGGWGGSSEKQVQPAPGLGARRAPPAFPAPALSLQGPSLPPTQRAQHRNTRQTMGHFAFAPPHGGDTVSARQRRTLTLTGSLSRWAGWVQPGRGAACCRLPLA